MGVVQLWLLHPKFFRIPFGVKSLLFLPRVQILAPLRASVGPLQDSSRWSSRSWLQTSLLNIRSPLTFHQMKRNLDTGKRSSSHPRRSHFSQANRHLQGGGTVAPHALVDPAGFNEFTQAGWIHAGVTFNKVCDANISPALCVSVCTSLIFHFYAPGCLLWNWRILHWFDILISESKE